MKCVAITNFFPAHRGGLEIIAGEILSRLSADDGSGMKFEWFASETTSATGVAHRADDHASVDPRVIIHALPCWNLLERRTGLPMPVWPPHAILRLAQGIARCDAVFLNDCLYPSSVIGWLLAKIYRRPVVVLQHIDMIPFRSRLLSWLMSAGYRVLGWLVLCHSAQVVFCSSKVEKYFKHLFPRSLSRSVRISNGLDVAVFSPGAIDSGITLPARPRFLFAGRFIERKGLEILKELAIRFPGCDWVFAGWGVIDPAAWKLANVIVAGSCDRTQMLELYRSCDALILPSAGEGFPLVVQEAISCGLPAFVTPETASGDPAAAGVLIVAERSVGAFDAAVRAFLGRRREELSVEKRLARHRFAVANWGWNRITAHWMEVFKGLEQA
ncbi:MAG: hypothetical protein RIQ81_1303 [Pseudomonadota bacterium]|jgi:glycosyltransferase involved in cell wall biosynthesis